MNVNSVEQQQNNLTPPDLRARNLSMRDCAIIKQAG
jgi:hypothetical protein